MPRNMSFAMTTAQYRDGSKDVTRRWAWENAKPGDLIMGVEKAMGLKKGEKMVRLGPAEILSVRRERLDRMITDPAYGAEELRREGYPFGLTDPADFVERLIYKTKKKPSDLITRIEFRKIPA